METTSKHNSIKNFSMPEWLMIIGVSVLSLFFLVTLSQEVFKKPAFDQFCKTEMYQKIYDTKIACNEIGGDWTEFATSDAQNKKIMSGSCHPQATCQREFDAAQKKYSTSEFMSIAFVSFVLLIIGFFLKRKSYLASFAVICGALFSIIVDHMMHWDLVSGFLRPMILLLALGLLIYGIIKKDSL